MPGCFPRYRAGACVALLAALMLSIGAASNRCMAAASLHDTIRDVQRKVVKIYGAGGLRGLEAYQTGLLISAEGHVLTVQSYVLDTDELAIVLDDGRKYEAEFLGVDPVRELAVLQLKAEDAAFPHFELAAATVAKPGERILAVSNLFGIATGDEPVSVLQGVVTAIAPLDARRGAFHSAFHGEVYIVDAAANNPGAAGGALVNWQGELLGLLGKELRSNSTGAWLHYALPIDQLIGSVETIRSGRSVEEDSIVEDAPAEPLTLGDLGIVLVPDVLPRTPPYIDSVLPHTPAAKAGLRPDDLVVFVDGEPTVSCSAVTTAVSRREKFDAVRISVLRDGKLIEKSFDASVSADDEEAPNADDDGNNNEHESTDPAEESDDSPATDSPTDENE